MFEKCKINECSFEKYKEYEFCVLHCEKHDYKTDFESGLLEKFYNSLVTYCRRFLAPHCREKAPIDDIEGFLKSTATNKINESGNLNNRREGLSKNIQFDRIKFPERKYGDAHDFFPIFRSFENIHFSACHIYFSELNDFQNAKFFFESCEFMNDWQITPISIADIHENMLGFLFQTCTFHKAVMNDNPQLQIKGRTEIDGNLFYLCDFLGDIAFQGLVINGMLFSEQTKKDTKLKMLSIVNCILKSKFYFNEKNCSIVLLKDSLFENKFEMKFCKHYYFEINNCNFSKVSDLYHSFYTNFYTHKSIFHKFVGFEKCIFGHSLEELVIEDAICKKTDKIARFEYVTFENFINFRDTQFLNGLDLRNINPSQQPNFLGSKIDPKNTNRETFRIVKHSFDSMGNHIDANRFFREEMEKYRIELKDKKRHYAEKLIFFVNKASSDYGQSYTRPIFLIFLFMLLHTMLRIGYTNNWLYVSDSNFFDVIDKISKSLNFYALSLTPIKDFLSEGFEFLSLFFYVIYAVLIYQTIVALKRMSKR